MIRYFGGKFHMAEWISKQFPSGIKTYVKPFSGAFWVYFKGGERFSNYKCVYNDINKYMYNLFLCSNLDPETLLNHIEKNNNNINKETLIVIIKYYSLTIKMSLFLLLLPIMMWHINFLI